MNFIYKLITYFKKPVAEMPQFEQYELTDWYPADIKPVNLGIYQIECQIPGQYIYSIWDGKLWCYEYDMSPLIYQNRKWRGIKK